MVIIAGCVIVRDNKILMVKEAKKKCFGQWNFPAGHVDEHELITEAAIREAYEETGCKVKLTGVLPISCVDFKNGETHTMVRFTADIVEENIKFDTSIQFIKDFEDGKVYPLDVFNNTKYIR